MNKRGQFFLLAAFIIIGIVIGLSSAVNSVRVNIEDTRFYDLAEEIGFETKQVLNYGIYQGDDINTLLEGFLIDYAEYIAQEQVLFVYGNDETIKALFFEEEISGIIQIGTGAPGPGIPIGGISEEEANVEFDIDADGLKDDEDSDMDGDGSDNIIDNCPKHYNPSQSDSDGDGDGDACDGVLSPFNAEPGIRTLVLVEINEIVYRFELKEGENFFLVIIKEENEEKIVATR